MAKYLNNLPNMSYNYFRGDKMLQKTVKTMEDGLYFVFRAVIGLLFFGHGAQKLFGLFGGSQAQLFNMFWFAGAIEVVAGLLIVFGLFTRIAAAVGAVEMIAALVIAHIPRGINIYKNGGETPVLFFAAFLVLFVYGARKWNIEQLLWKKEKF